MGQKVKLTSGTHRRTGEDGTPVVFEAGDVFEATDAELDAFGDKLEPVEKGDDGWTVTRSEPGVDEPEDGTYRLLRGTHRTTDDDGNPVTVEEGETVFLTEQEAAAFGDKFEKVDSDGGAEGDSSVETASDETATETTAADADGADSAEGDDDVDETSESVAESGTALVTPDGVDVPDEFPDAVPDADEWGWDALREVSKANDVDASQSKPEQVDDLRSIAE